MTTTLDTRLASANDLFLNKETDRLIALRDANAYVALAKMNVAPISRLMTRFHSLNQLLSKAPTTLTSNPLFSEYQIELEKFQLLDNHDPEKKELAAKIGQDRRKLLPLPLFKAWDDRRSTLGQELDILKEAIAKDPWMKKHNALKGEMEKLARLKESSDEKRFVLPQIYIIPPLVMTHRPPIPRPKNSSSLLEWIHILFDIFNATVFSNMLPPIDLKIVDDQGGIYGSYIAGSVSELYHRTPLEHVFPHTPFQMIFSLSALGGTFGGTFGGTSSGTFGGSFELCKRAVLHEMCHYYIGILENKLNRLPLIKVSHDNDWKAICCHAMEVYPDVQLAEYPGEIINCRLPSMKR